MDLASQLHETLLVDQLFLLNVVHSAFVIHGIKKWLDAKKRPLASFILTFINCYISGLLVNLACNTPLLSSMKNNELNCAIVLLWWLVNFATPGFFDFIFTSKPILFVLLGLKETLRCRKLYLAMDKGAAAYDNHLLLSVAIGTSGACGGGFIKHAMALFKNEKTQSSFAPATKCSVFFTALYMLQKMEIIEYRRIDIILLQSIAMTAIQFSAVLGRPIDPFAAPEKIACQVFFSMGRDLETKKKE